MKQFLYCLFLVFYSTILMAQTDLCRKSTEGTDFWFGFMESRNYHSGHFVDITVTSRETTSFQLFIGNSETRYNSTYTVQSNGSLRVQIPWEFVEATGSEEIQDKGIHLVSEKPVNVYALNWDANSADVAVIYPTSSLGNEYFAICYEPNISERSNGDYGNGRNSEFLIVATEDETKVLIVPSKVTDKLVSAGDTIEKILNKGEVFQVQSMNRKNLTGQGDLTGSYVLSDKPVAFYSGSLGTTVPADPGTSAWDHLYEQIPPIYSWGREYYAVPLKSREQDLYRIMAAQDGTTVYIDGLPEIQLNRGEFEEVILFHDQPKRIFAEKPILVVQYSQSQSIDKAYTGGNGDPFMIVLSSTTQSKNDVTFVAYDSNQIQKYYVNVITLTEETGNIRFDGANVQSQFKPFENSDYSWAQIALTPGTYRIWNTNKDRGFLAYVYGFGGVESYGYGVGFNLDLVLDLGESINFNGDTLLLCYGESRTLDAGPYFDSYTWNTGDTVQKVTVNEGGKYAVKTTTIDGCELEDSIFVFVSHPEIELGTEYDEGCFPYQLELDGNDGFAKYLWQNENGDTLSTAQTIQADQTGEYRISSYDQYNCVARDTMNLTVFPVPKLEITGDTLLCGELSSALNVSITDAPESIWNYEGSYSWSSNNPLRINFLNEQHTSVNIEATEYGTYEIYYLLTTVDGCFAADTFTVRYHQNPSSIFKFEDDAKCEGYSKKLVYTGQATDSANFYWDLDGSIFVDTIGWQQYNVSVGAFLEKSPYISLVINDNECWSDTTITPLGAKPNFTMEADNLRGCDELTANFYSKLLTADQVDFQWEFSDGEIVNNQNATKYFDSPGYYDVSLTITNPVTGCQNGFTLDSMVKVFPTPQASIVADPTFCYDDSAQIYYGGNIDSSFCTWTFDGGSQLGEGNDSITVFLDKPTTTVTLQVDEYGCVSDPVDRIIKRKPRFDFFTDDPEGCQPLSIQIHAESPDSSLNYDWSSEFLQSAEKESGLFSFPDSGKYDIGLIVSSETTSCTDTLFKPDWIWVHPKPNALFEVDFPVALIENATISFFNQTENASFYEWDFGDNSTSSEFNPIHQYLELGEFFPQLIAESEFGCLDTTELTINILPFDVYTPNAFRPDSEIPENRTFMPVGLGADISRFSFKVYDRLGQLIFETNTPENSWDGTNKNGVKMPMANYVWIASFYDIQGYQHNQKGQVILVR